MGKTEKRRKNWFQEKLEYRANTREKIQKVHIIFAKNKKVVYFILGDFYYLIHWGRGTFKEKTFTKNEKAM